MIDVIAADTAASSAPWWGVPIVAGSFALLGVGLTLMGTYLAERRRTARDDAQRWDKDARQVCATFCRMLSREVLKLSDAIESDEEELPARPSMEDDEATQHWFELQLIAPTDVVEAAYAMFQRYNLLVFIWDHPAGVNYRALLAAFAMARANYLDIVRKHYNLGSLPEFTDDGTAEAVINDANKRLHDKLYFPAVPPVMPDEPE